MRQKIPNVGDTRVKKRFQIFPITLPANDDDGRKWRRYLERVEVCQELIRIGTYQVTGLPITAWRDICWADIGEL